MNGPEVLNKYVGQAEENIRNLFADAEKDEKTLGENSPLHVVIFDEIDSICKSRGSTRDGTGVHDSIVNQLLSKIDAGWCSGTFFVFSFSWEFPHPN